MCSYMIDEGKIAKSQNRVGRGKKLSRSGNFHAYHPRNDDIAFRRVRGVVLQISTYIFRRERNYAHPSTDCYFSICQHFFLTFHEI